MRNILLATILTFFTAHLAVAQERNSFHLSFSDADPRTVEVTAVWVEEDNTLGTAPWGHPYLDKGWATFMSNMSATDSSGNPVNLFQKENGDWVIPDGTPRPLNLSYAVSLTHDEYDWDEVGGIDSRPRVVDGAIFLITKALFVGSFEMGESEVSVSLPTEWQVDTPWKDSGINQWVATDYYDLINNMIVVGDYISYAINEDDFHVTVAIDRTLADYAPQFGEILQKIIPEYKAIFGSVPDLDYLVGISGAPSTDGESFNTSFHQVMKIDDIEGGYRIWAAVMAHEMFHFWNGGGMLRPEVHAELAFFNEGFTEYYAILCMTRAGLFSAEEYMRKLEMEFSRYFIANRRWPLEVQDFVTSGKEKGTNWLRLYGGGTTLAFYLDMLIREKTENQSSLDSVMAALVAAHGNHTPVAVADVENAVARVLGSKTKEIFDRYVRSAEEMIPYQAAGEHVGMRIIQYGDEHQISLLQDVEQSIARNLALYLKSGVAK